MADKNDNRKRNSGDQSERKTGSQALGDYSQSLGTVANQLSGAAKSFTETVGRIENSNDQLIDALQDFAKAFGKEMKNNHKTTKKQNQEDLDDLSDTFDRALRDKETSDKETINMGQKVGGALINTAKQVFSTIFNIFLQNFNKVMDDYNANLESVTSRMQKSNHEYSEMLNRATDRISSEKLKLEFSQIDFNKALQPVLQTGIRGVTAERMAFSNMITERVLPMLNTTTRQYTRMSKIFGDKFTQGIQAIGTYTQSYLDSAEGLEEGGLDTAIQTIYREVQDQVRLEGGTKDDVTNRMENIIGVYTTAAANFGKDYAEKTLQDYSSFIRGESIMQADLESLMPGINAKDASFEEYIQAQQRLIEKYMSTMPASYASSAFGFDVTVIEDYLNGVYYQGKENLKDSEDLMKHFNAEAENKKTMDNLQQGFYQSVTDQMDNFNENLVAYTATWAGEYIPHFDTWFGMIRSILNIWFPLIELAILKNGFSKNSGSGGQASNSLMNKFFRGDSGTSFTEAFKDGANYAKFGGASKFGSLNAGLQNALGTTGGNGFAGASTAGGSLLNFAAGPGALIAGGIWAGVDAYKGGKATWEDTHDVGITIGSGALSALTGRGLMTKEKEKSNIEKALAGEHVAFDWGSAGANAGKGALIGAGVGTAAGGWAAGMGTVIGTAVGAIGGFVSNAIQQAIENAKFNKFADTVKSTTEALDTLTSATNELVSAREKESDVINAVTKIKNSENSSTEEFQEGLRELAEQLPEYSVLIGNITSKDDEYLGVLQDLITLQRIDAERKAAEALGTTTENLSGSISAASELVGSAQFEKYAYDLASAVTGDLGYYDDAGLNKLLREQYSDYLAVTGKEDTRESFDTFISGLNNAGAGGSLAYYGANDWKIISEDAKSDAYKSWQAGEDVFGTSSSTGAWTMGNNYTQEIERTEDPSLKIKSKYDEVLSYVEDTWAQILSNAVTQLYPRIYEEKEDGTRVLKGIDEIRKSYEDEGLADAYNYYKTSLEQLTEGAAEIRSMAPLLGGITAATYGLFGKQAENYFDLWEAFGVAPPQFKSGTYSVPFDNYPAILHAGEMVLPEAAAENLRNISEASNILEVSNYLAGLVNAQGSSVASPIADETVMTSLSNAIDTQTRLLVVELQSIYKAVSSIYGVLDGVQRKSSVSSSIPKSVLRGEYLPLET